MVTSHVHKQRADDARDRAIVALVHVASDVDWGVVTLADVVHIMHLSRVSVAKRLRLLIEDGLAEACILKGATLYRPTPVGKRHAARVVAASV